MTHTRLGIYHMVAAIAALSAMDAAVKWLVLRDLPVLQILALRGWIVTGVLAGIITLRYDISVLATRHWRLHLLRSVCGFLAPLSFFVALKTMALADATALFFCAIFFTTAGSAWLLGEHVGIRRWLAVIVGFAGVVLIARPGSDTLQISATLPMVAAVSYAGLMLLGRKLALTENTLSLMFYLNAALTLIATSTLPFVWHPVGGDEFAMVLVASALALVGYYLITRAFTLAPLSVIAPYEYSALVWALLLGYVLWGEVPHATAWMGMAIIVLSGWYILRREHGH